MLEKRKMPATVNFAVKTHWFALKEGLRVFFNLTWYAHKYYTCTLNKAKTVHSPVYDDLGFFVIHRRLWEFRLDNNKLS